MRGGIPNCLENMPFIVGSGNRRTAGMFQSFQEIVVSAGESPENGNIHCISDDYR
jgi:hypothetical protein